MSDWKAPEGHPISIEEAKKLATDPAYVRSCLNILDGCTAAFYWFQKNKENPEIPNNGTITFVQTPKKLLGITALHVLEGFRAVSDNHICQIGTGGCEDLLKRVIDSNKDLDLVTIDFSDFDVKSFGKEISPLTSWPPTNPQVGRGIMLGGFPGFGRKLTGPMQVEFHGFFSIGVATSLSDRQISWRLEREYCQHIPNYTEVPANADLGGISGGALLTLIETPAGLAYYTLAGIIVQASAEYENVVAIKADLISENGKIRNI